MARKRPAENIDSGKNKRAKTGSVPANTDVLSRSLLLENQN